jgi:hypothetical protein
LLGEQTGKLRFLARFQDQDAVTVQSVSHDIALTPFAFCLFILPVAGIGAMALRVIEQGRKSLFHPDLNCNQAPPCQTINSY